jgi:membrane protein
MKSLLQFEWKRFFIRLYGLSFDADIFSRAAQVAFYFSFAIFPFIYFLISLFGLLLESSDSLRTELYTYLRQMMPATVFDLVKRTMDEIVANSTGGKVTLGLVVTLWSASAGVDSLRSALNAIYEQKESRMWLKTKAQSLVLTLVVTVLATLVLATVFYGWQLVQLGLAGVGLQVSSPWVLVTIQWVAILLVTLFACEVIYNLLPDFKEFHWIWINPGSVVAIILWIVLSMGFRFYLEYFNTYNKAYGSLGAMMVTMLWLYLIAMTLMIGGAINAVLHEMRSLRDEPPTHA